MNDRYVQSGINIGDVEETETEDLIFLLDSIIQVIAGLDFVEWERAKRYCRPVMDGRAVIRDLFKRCYMQPHNLPECRRAEAELRAEFGLLPK